MISREIVIACGLFFLGSHKESNLKILAMARKHNLGSTMEEFWEVPSLLYLAWLTILTILV